MHKIYKYSIVTILFVLTNSKASAQFKLPHFLIFANVIYGNPCNDEFKNTYIAEISD